MRIAVFLALLFAVCVHAQLQYPGVPIRGVAQPINLNPLAQQYSDIAFGSGLPITPVSLGGLGYSGVGTLGNVGGIQAVPLGMGAGAAIAPTSGGVLSPFAQQQFPVQQPIMQFPSYPTTLPINQFGSYSPFTPYTQQPTLSPFTQQPIVSPFSQQPIVSPFTQQPIVSPLVGNVGYGINPLTGINVANPGLVQLNPITGMPIQGLGTINTASTPYPLQFPITQQPVTGIPMSGFGAQAANIPRAVPIQIRN